MVANFQFSFLIMFLQFNVNAILCCLTVKVTAGMCACVLLKNNLTDNLLNLVSIQKGIICECVLCKGVIMTAETDALPVG